MNDHKWEPILAGDDAAHARAVVGEIAAALARRPPSDALGLKGSAATALLLDACGSADAAVWLEAALTTSTSGPATISLFGGVAGVSWVLNQLAAGPEADAMLAHFDAALWRHLDVPQWHERHDLMSGLAGVGVLVAQRSDASARRIAERVLSHLESTAIASGPGVTWRTAPKFLPPHQQARFPDGKIDLGVAHGVPGVIGMLAQFLEADIEPERSGALLSRAVAWLLSAAPLGCPRYGTSWPIDCLDDKRVGWCYGDVGVAGALLGASRALDSRDLASEALGLLRQSVEVLRSRELRHSGFCHGAAGLAHVYNAAFQHTRDPELRVQAVHWLRELLRMRRPGSGVAGYTSLDVDGERRNEDVTLVSGVVGIALVLLAAVEDHEPAWSQLFVV